MISGATRGGGGPALGNHLASLAGNDAVRVLEGRGLIALDIQAQIAELTKLGSFTGTRTPLYHVHADPPGAMPWSDEERAQYWNRFEQEFGFEDRPYAAVVHVKSGREHEHRVYLRVKADGRAIRLDHDYARRERLDREFEVERGEPITVGAHNRAVIHALDQQGKAKVADAMRRAGSDQAARSVAPLSPKQRAQQERTGVQLSDVTAEVLKAWNESDSGRSFRAALAEKGIELGQGDKVTVIRDRSGALHPLARLLAKAAKAGGREQIRAIHVGARLQGLDMPKLQPSDRIPFFLVQAEPSVLSSPVGGGEHRESTSSRPDEVSAFPEIKAANKTTEGNKEIWNEYAARIETRIAEVLDSRRCKGDPGGGSGRGEQASASGPQRLEPRKFCRPPGSQDGGFTSSAPGTVGAAYRGRDRQDQSHNSIAGEGGGESNLSRAAHGRARISLLRTWRAFAWHELEQEQQATVVYCGISLHQEGLCKKERRYRRERWLAATLGRAYDTSWVPPSIVRNIRHIGVDRENGAIRLTLHSGSYLVDRMDRIDLVGPADEIAVKEMVAAALRRGWTEVAVHGDERFRRAAAIQFTLLDPPVPVINNPLTGQEMAELQVRRLCADAQETERANAGFRSG